MTGTGKRKARYSLEKSSSRIARDRYSDNRCEWSVAFCGVIASMTNDDAIRRWEREMRRTGEWGMGMVPG